MRFSEDVKPVDELITNGTAKAVLMDVASCDRWRDTAAMLKLIAQSGADVEAGRTVSQDEAFARAECTISQVEQAD